MNNSLVKKAASLYPQFFIDGEFKRHKSLLSIDGNAKTVKGQKKGFKTAIMYLIASDHSGLINLCPCATAGCRAACLLTAGRGVYENVRNGRLHKTLFFALYRDEFMAQIFKEIEKLSKRFEKQGQNFAVRLNGTSDIQFENIPVNGFANIFEAFPNVQFYDYTKIARRFFKDLPNNYHLTFSRAETNEKIAETILSKGKNIAVVFNSSALPSTWKGFKVIDGDENDLRFMDPENIIVGLKAKGRAKKDASGFVVNVK